MLSCSFKLSYLSLLFFYFYFVLLYFIFVPLYSHLLFHCLSFSSFFIFPFFSFSFLFSFFFICLSFFGLFFFTLYPSISQSIPFSFSLSVSVSLSSLLPCLPAYLLPLYSSKSRKFIKSTILVGHVT